MAKLKQTVSEERGDDKWMNEELHNPLTETGRKVLKSMRKQYGSKAEKVFYATANKYGKRWHK